MPKTDIVRTTIPIIRNGLTGGFGSSPGSTGAVLPKAGFATEAYVESRFRSQFFLAG
jgi:hypothetical protein